MLSRIHPTVNIGIRPGELANNPAILTIQFQDFSIPWSALSMFVSQVLISPPPSTLLKDVPVFEQIPLGYLKVQESEKKYLEVELWCPKSSDNSGFCPYSPEQWTLLKREVWSRFLDVGDI